MNRSFLMCVLAASIAAPTAINATNLHPTTHVGQALLPDEATSTDVFTGHSRSRKPGKSKKHKKKMNKQMKKRRHH